MLGGRRYCDGASNVPYDESLRCRKCTRYKINHLCHASSLCQKSRIAGVFGVSRAARIACNLISKIIHIDILVSVPLSSTRERLAGSRNQQSMMYRALSRTQFSDRGLMRWVLRRAFGLRSLCDHPDASIDLWRMRLSARNIQWVGR